MEGETEGGREGVEGGREAGHRLLDNIYTAKTKVCTLYLRNALCKQQGLYSTHQCLQRAFLQYVVHTFIFAVYSIIDIDIHKST